MKGGILQQWATSATPALVRYDQRAEPADGAALSALGCELIGLAMSQVVKLGVGRRLSGSIFEVVQP
jgi:hypothetical protein